MHRGVILDITLYAEKYRQDLIWKTDMSSLHLTVVCHN